MIILAVLCMFLMVAYAGYVQTHEKTYEVRKELVLTSKNKNKKNKKKK